ncbi:gamma-tubulin complex component GCP6 [Aspergillus sp. HF37]|nr:gamma-tubulin complex component GCP6 [Aspergillus sp. HF37]
MDPDDYEADPFSSESLWRLSKFSTLSLQPLESLPWKDELPELTGGFFEDPFKIFDGDYSSLRELNVSADSFESDPSHDSTTDVSSETHVDANVDHPENASDKLEDIWSLDLLNDGQSHKPTLRSWEIYQDPSFCEPASAYFSESGARGFDAALAHNASNGKSRNSGRLVRNGVFFQALLQLGLGRSSMFFRYNAKARVFEKVVDDIRVSGISLPATNSLIGEMLQCGTEMQRVRSFVRNNQGKSNGISALSTFAGAAAAIMYTTEKHVATSSEHAVSLLQIKALFQRPGELVGALASMLDAIEKASSDADVISIVFREVAYLSQMFAWMESLLHDIAACVADPWLKFVETWVGLRPETPMSIEQVANGKSFASLEYLEDKRRMKLEPTRVDYNYRQDQMPSFIPADQAELIFETGKSLRLLKRSHPRHPIANRTVLRGADPPSLSCTVTWTDIERIQDRAHEYEAKLCDEILKYNVGKASRKETQWEPTSECLDENSGNKTIAHTFELFDLEDKQYMTGLFATPSSMQNGKLGQLLDESNSRGPELPESNFSPELASTLYLSLAPVISSQAHLVDFSCLDLLFKEHKIRYHLTLQWRFQLLGDGYFTSRLSHSLFDPGMRSGERKSGMVRTGIHAGLRLGSRDTWPPATSELRLVLIGLLKECYSAYDGLRDSESSQLDKKKDLPGGLSFGVRELTEEEIAKYRDPNAVGALDFLRLQYKPPVVLETIITKRSLNKYDSLFRHLLRLIRMVSVVNGLIRDSTARDSLSGDTRNVFQKFRVDSQRFTLAVSDYCFHVGVGSTWQQFQDTLSRIERCLYRGDIDGTIEVAHSVPWLRNYHEDILDQMLFALFLSKKHAQAAALLENIFHTILTFAPLSRMDGTSGVRHESEAAALKLYATFRKQTSAFVGYLRGLDGEKASSKSMSRSSTAFASPSKSTSVFEHLLLRLDMKEYY